MSANIDKLRELAMGATGGAWRTESYYDMDGVRRTILIPFSLELPPGMEESDMTYIAAANPDAVLALLDELDTAHTARRAAQARVAELTEQVQALGRKLHRHKLDAARYRWLRSAEGCGFPGIVVYEPDTGEMYVVTGVDADAAIDAAMRAGCVREAA